MSNLKKKLIKETSWGIATKAIVFPMFFLINIFLARTLGPDLWGAWSLFFSILTIAFLFVMFGVKATIKFTAQHNYTEALPNVLKDAFILRIAISSVFAIGFFLLSTPLAQWMQRPEFDSLFKLASPIIFLTGFVEHFKGVFTGLHRIKFNFFTSASEFSLKLLLIVALLTFVGVSLNNVVLAFGLALTISMFVAGGLLYNNYRSLPANESPHSYVSEIFKYSLPLFIISAGFAIATEVDTLMLGWLANDLAVGDYAIAKQLVTKLPHLSYAIAMGTMPIFAQITKENLAERKKLFGRLLKLNSLLFVPIVAGIWLLSAWAIPFVYGTAYVGAVYPLQILSVYVLIFTYSVFFNQFLDYQGLAKKRAINLLLSLFINIGLNYYLIPIYSATGAAISTSIAYLPYLLLNIWETNKVFKDLKK